MASLKASHFNVLPEHIFWLSFVGLGRIEQMIDVPSRLMTTGQQIVASPMVAASKGTGMMYKTY